MEDVKEAKKLISRIREERRVDIDGGTDANAQDVERASAMYTTFELHPGNFANLRQIVRTIV